MLQGFFVYIVFQNFFKNNNRESGDLQSVFLTVNAWGLQFLLQCTFFVHTLAWQVGGSRRCSSLRAVRRLGSLQEKPLWSRLGHIQQQTLAGGSSGRGKVCRVEREGKPFNHPSKQQQGLQEWHITSLLTISIIHYWFEHMDDKPWGIENCLKWQNTVWGTHSCSRLEAQACSPC